MKKTVSAILCVLVVLSLLTLASCGDGEKKVTPVELKFISEPATGYEWHVAVSRKGIVKVKETFEENEDDKNNPKGGWQVYTVTPVGKGEVTLDFAYTAPGVEKVELVATYVYTVDENLKMREKLREGTYFDLDNVVPQNTYVIRLDVDGSGNKWDYVSEPDGIVEISHEYIPDPYALETDTKKGEHVFTVMGMKSGKVTVNFVYADENGENPAADAKYELEVDDELIVSEIKHEGSYFKED